MTLILDHLSKQLYVSAAGEPHVITNRLPSKTLIGITLDKDHYGRHQSRILALVVRLDFKECAVVVSIYALTVILVTGSDNSFLVKTYLVYCKLSGDG